MRTSDGNWRRVFCKRFGHEYHNTITPGRVSLSFVCLRCYGGAEVPGIEAVLRIKEASHD